MITVEFAAGVEVVVAIVRMHVPEPTTELGAKLEVAPAGRPVAVNSTVPAKRPVALTFTLKAVLPPPPEVPVFGVAEIKKSAFPDPPLPAPPLQDDSAAITGRND